MGYKIWGPQCQALFRKPLRFWPSLELYLTIIWPFPGFSLTFIKFARVNRSWEMTLSLTIRDDQLQEQEAESHVSEDSQDLEPQPARVTPRGRGRGQALKWSRRLLLETFIRYVMILSRWRKCINTFYLINVLKCIYCYPKSCVMYEVKTFFGSKVTLCNSSFVLTWTLLCCFPQGAAAAAICSLGGPSCLMPLPRSRSVHLVVAMLWLSFDCV